MSKVVPLHLAAEAVNEDGVKLIEGLLERLRSGEAVAVAVVEVMKAGTVATAYSASSSYHQLNSGAARLSSRLASEPGD